MVLEMQNDCTEIKLGDERKAGETLREGNELTSRNAVTRCYRVTTDIIKKVKRIQEAVAPLAAAQSR